MELGASHHLAQNAQACPWPTFDGSNLEHFQGYETIFQRLSTEIPEIEGLCDAPSGCCQAIDWSIRGSRSTDMIWVNHITYE